MISYSQAESEEKCNHLVRQFLKLCEKINCPVSLEKTEWASQKMIFLGILIDGKNKILVIPEKKRIKAIKLIQDIVSKRTAKVVDLQRLTGTLNFLNRAIVPGRVFTRQLYALTTSTKRKLKPFHHVNLNREFKFDCEVWKTFLLNDSRGICRPFVDIDESVWADKLKFWTDASRAYDKGFWLCVWKRMGFWTVGTRLHTVLSAKYRVLGVICLVYGYIHLGTQTDGYSNHNIL